MNAFQTIRPESLAASAPEYPVNLYQAPDDETWIAESDSLPLATEAATIDALIERVWEIAPEIAALNDHRGELNLRFIVHTRARS
jgi:hypothetical protein